MSEDTSLSRGELGIRMLCAWNNIPRDKAPASWSEHHNEWTRDAWARVAEAAIRHHAANSDGGVEPDAYVDWKSQCVYMAESIKDPSGLQPVWFAHPPAKALDGIAVKALEVDALAQEIRRVDGNNVLGAGELAEVLLPFLTAALK